ncbi:MAG TPA: antitoxin VapB family protein [Thermoplasmata archaeon]|nr:antitoxin VapB family protein [Thermoplasmata archaeon]
MSSRNVALRRDIYDSLRREMRPGESFTRVLERLLHERGGLGDLAGSWGRGDEAALGRRWRALRAGRGRR